MYTDLGKAARFSCCKPFCVKTRENYNLGMEQLVALNCTGDGVQLCKTVGPELHGRGQAEASVRWA